MWKFRHLNVSPPDRFHSSAPTASRSSPPMSPPPTPLFASPPTRASSRRGKAPLCPCCHNYLCDGEHMLARNKASSAASSGGAADGSDQHETIFDELPDDALITIARACGRDLTTFAAINATCRRIASSPSMWKHAYQTASDDVDEWGDMPDSMWRACLVHSTAKRRQKELANTSS